MLTPLELDIMKAVWKQPPVTVRDVQAEIRPRAESRLHDGHDDHGSPVPEGLLDTSTPGTYAFIFARDRLRRSPGQSCEDSDQQLF